MAQSIAERLAELDPTAPSEVDSTLFCFFCNAHDPDRIEPHSPDCLWLAAKNTPVLPADLSEALDRFMASPECPENASREEAIVLLLREALTGLGLLPAWGG